MISNVLRLFAINRHVPSFDTHFSKRQIKKEELCDSKILEGDSYCDKRHKNDISSIHHQNIPR